jgi:teichuronic acid biosynthesis glycosyltransferase TuaG
LMSLVSIITPTFNNQDTIEDTWISVKNQTYENWEWIVVNDGSTDGTKAFLNTIKSKKVRIIQLLKNSGVSAARNRALQFMRGDFFILLDADDILPENSINARVKMFDRDSTLDFVDGKVSIFKNNLRDRIVVYSPQFYGTPLKELLSLSGKVFFGNTWMIKRNRSINYQFKNGLKHAEDLLFFISIAGNGIYSAIDEDVLYCRRNGNTAMSNIKGLETGYNALKKELIMLPNTLQDLHLYRKKSSLIMLKSYMKEGSLLAAIRAYFRLRF